ncbi:alpha/beta hydrolase fold domain-containing protein [Alloyangia pacifica]|uniref:Transcriptional regulator, TetR family n=1 Tax=Alloyangia pacifica TaxID=311180 RepID=A0A1I6ULE9_9RHOB|nr:alpha/beta hydrolase fold domain-containing protein [Alloyangia pacifica]SDH74550.1 transcriptional regulator, TetR family [Alloyangia pacifica]SFT02285.1 transcriptional regulator, TetR family [Alloyangia pacifica]
MEDATVIKRDPETDGNGASRRHWKQNPEAVRANILQVARKAFVKHGLTGAKIDDIASGTETSKRMIYYYFGDKEGLYRAVLEDAYARVRAAEDELELASLHPVEALRRLAEFTFDHHAAHEDFVRLVMVENLHHGRHMKKVGDLSGQNISAIRLLDQIYQRGCTEGLFRRGLTPLELHWHISALAIFNVANRATFSSLFGDSLFEPKGQQQLRRHVGDMLLRFVMKPGLSVEEASARPIAETRAIHPDIYRFRETWDATWATLPTEGDAATRRLHFESVSRSLRLPSPEGVDTDEEHWIDTESGPVRVRLFRPHGSEPLPALVYLHGGAWRQGSPETHWNITARLAAWSGHLVISVDYALAPEHPYPHALRQIPAVIAWAREQAETLGIDPARLAIGGDGAGGNLAAAVTLLSRDAGVPLSAQLLIYPVCDFDTSRPSCSEYAEGPLWTLAQLLSAHAQYCPDEAARQSDPLIAPLVATRHDRLPPAYLALAEHDPLRDGGIAYGAALQAAAVPVQVDPGKGLVRDYLHAIGFGSVAEERLREMSLWLKEVAG